MITMNELDALNRIWTDISNETYRIYCFANGVYQIDDPLWLYVSNSGGHRIFDKEGMSHYILPTWLGLQWATKPDKQKFVK